MQLLRSLLFIVWLAMVFGFNSVPMHSRFMCPAERLPPFSRFRKATDSRPLSIRFSNTAGPRPLRLFDERYTNSFGEPFSIQQFKYYISAIRVTGEGQDQLLIDQPHLVDAGDSSSLVLHLSTTLSGVRSIRFVIGVDSAANTGGVKTGDLDPMLGMFWTWNTGYIDARLEGVSDSAHSPAHRFTWDVGGYKTPANAIRTITLILPDPLKGSIPDRGSTSGQGSVPDRGSTSGQGSGPDQESTSGQGSASARAPDSSVIVITADLLKWFDGAHPIRLAQSPICHQPGALAMQLADNYSTMFSVNLINR